MYFFSKNFQ